MSRFAVAKLMVVASLSVCLGGCAEWALVRGPAPAATSAATERGRKGTIRVELNSGELVAMSGATVRHDSVVGVTIATLGHAPQPVGVAVSDVRRVEYEYIDVALPLKYYTRWIVVLVVLAVMGLALALMSLGD